MQTKKKGLNIDLTTGQYMMLHNLMCDSQDRGYDQILMRVKNRYTNI